MIHHRLASASDLLRYYGEQQEKTVKAIVILMDEDPVAVTGITVERGHHVAFSEYKPELEPHLKSMPVLRALKAVQGMFAAARLPVYAIRTVENCLLERLGFRRLQDEVFLWAE
jgi:hypothetical protein